MVDCCFECRDWGEDLGSSLRDRERSYTITGAPRVAKGKVYIGNGGAEYGVRGYVTAYDSETEIKNGDFYSPWKSTRF